MYYKSKNRFMKNRGFTLIELIIVIAILGVIAAILIPNFTSFFDTAKESTCLANREVIERAERVYYTLNGHDSGGENSTYFNNEVFEDSISRLVDAGFINSSIDFCPLDGSYSWSETTESNTRFVLCSKHDAVNQNPLLHAPIEGLKLALNLSDSFSFLDENSFDYIINDTNNDGIDELGIIGSGFTLDGNRENISIGDDDRLDLTTEGTLQTWVKLNENSQFGGMIHKGEETNFSDEAYSLQFFGTNSPVLHLIDSSGSEHTLQTHQRLDLDTWYQITGTWDENGMKIYINGELAASNTDQVNVVNSSGPLQIGAQLNDDYNNAHNYFTINGSIDEVGIYDRSLTEDEIKNYYDDVLD